MSSQLSFSSAPLWILTTRAINPSRHMIVNPSRAITVMSSFMVFAILSCRSTAFLQTSDNAFLDNQSNNQPFSCGFRYYPFQNDSASTSLRCFRESPDRRMIWESHDYKRRILLPAIRNRYNNLYPGCELLF